MATIENVTVGSHWLYQSDGFPTHTIVIDSVHVGNGQFKGHYSEPADNASKFIGNVYRRQRSLLMLLQNDPDHVYHSVLVGMGDLHDPGRTGSWGDVTQTQVGKASLVPAVRVPPVKPPA